MGEPSKTSRATDRRGRNHFIVHQVYGTSCVPCCCAMVKHYWNTIDKCGKVSPEEEAMAASTWKEGEGMSFADAPDTIHKLVPDLEALHIRPGVKKLWETLKLWVTPKHPAIIELDHSWEAMGHAAICRYVDGDNWGFFLDPAKGLVEAHNTRLPHFRFNSTGKFLFGGALVVTRPRKKT
jgi:hypothetical protein